MPEDYPCPECGYDGPHVVVSRNPLVVECGDSECGVEFEIENG